MATAITLRTSVDRWSRVRCQRYLELLHRRPYGSCEPETRCRDPRRGHKSALLANVQHSRAVQSDTSGEKEYAGWENGPKHDTQSSTSTLRAGAHDGPMVPSSWYGTEVCVQARLLIGLESRIPAGCRLRAVEAAVRTRRCATRLRAAGRAPAPHISATAASCTLSAKDRAPRKSRARGMSRPQVRHRLLQCRTRPRAANGPLIPSRRPRRPCQQTCPCRSRTAPSTPPPAQRERTRTRRCQMKPCVCTGQCQMNGSFRRAVSPVRRRAAIFRRITTHPFLRAKGGVVTPPLDARGVRSAALLHAELVLVERSPA